MSLAEKFYLSQKSSVSGFKPFIEVSVIYHQVPKEGMHHIKYVQITCFFLLLSKLITRIEVFFSSVGSTKTFCLRFICTHL